MANILAIASLQILSFLLLASLGQSKIVHTNLVMYDHEFRAGPSKSIFPVAGLPNKTWGFDKFGTVAVFDNVLTQASSFKSALVGHSQGIAAISSLDNMNVELLLTVLFTNEDDQYYGSTIELKGIVVQSKKVNELAILGGTGKFRYATGYATFETVYLDLDHGVVTLKVSLNIRQDIEDSHCPSGKEMNDDLCLVMHLIDK